MNVPDFSSESALDRSAPTVSNLTIKHDPPHTIGSGWYPVQDGANLFIYVNWGHQEEISLKQQFNEIGEGLGGVKDQDKQIRVQIRWCADKGSLGENGGPLWQVADFVPLGVETENTNGNVKATQEEVSNKTKPEHRTVSHPLTLKGQQVGALLQVMRVPERIKKVRKGIEFNMIIEVGDICQVIETQTTSFQGKDRMDYVVDNLRTGARVLVPWSTFFEIGTREMCGCVRQGCHCEYADYEKSREFFAGL